jgi:hypothetical protein
VKRRFLLAHISLGWISSTAFRSVSALYSWLKTQTPALADSKRSSPAQFFVSPIGNDAWTGTLAAPNAAKTDGPLATLEQARNTIRKLKQSQGGTLKQPVHVLLRSGTYSLEKPLVLTPEDSGVSAFPVTYKAYPNESPTLSGGQPLKTWKAVTVAGKRLWLTEVDSVRSGQWFFRQLWVNGQPRPRSRHPKRGTFQVATVPDATPAIDWRQGQKRFGYNKGDLSNWPTATHAEIVMMSYWTTARMPIQEIDAGKQLVTCTRESVMRLEPEGSTSQGAATYYVENALEILDTPGEWYLNPTSGQLYYMPLPNESITTISAIVPRLSHLIELQGNRATNQFVEYVVFEGLTFTDAEWHYPVSSTVSDFDQAEAYIPGAIRAKAARSCSWHKCQISNVGSYGIDFSDGCTGNTVASCRLFNLGAGGIKVGHGTENSRIRDCHIYNGGRIFHGGVGILIMNSGNNGVSRNHIHDFYYSGISVGWTWGYEQNLAKNNVIELNHIHHLGQLKQGDEPRLDDKGGIYTLGVQPGTVIRGNRIHDVQAVHYGGWGIYLDAGSSQILIEKNLVYRTRDGSFHLHFGRDNQIRNNIFAFGQNGQLHRTKNEPHLSFTFEKNIVYWTKGALLAGTGWADGNYRFSQNVYWCTGKRGIDLGGISFQRWQANGQDRNSLIADPRLTAPEQNDFRLQANSPALNVGFQPLPQVRTSQTSQI